jgi:hypothetical protein
MYFTSSDKSEVRSELLNVVSVTDVVSRLSHGVVLYVDTKILQKIMMPPSGLILNMVQNMCALPFVGKDPHIKVKTVSAYSQHVTSGSTMGTMRFAWQIEA